MPTATNPASIRFVWVSKTGPQQCHPFCVLAPTHEIPTCLVRRVPPAIPSPFATPGVPPVLLSAPGNFGHAHTSLDCSHGHSGQFCNCFGRPIKFFKPDQFYYAFTNFSPHPVHFRGHVYATSEHLFQALKFIDTRPALADRIRQCATPGKARELAHELEGYMRPDWMTYRVEAMDLVLAHKFAQHPDLAQLLKWTGKRALWEDNPADGFWGVGKDGRGQNELGKALVRLRDRF